MKFAALAVAAVAAFAFSGGAEAADLTVKPRIIAKPQHAHLCKTTRALEQVPFDEIVTAVNVYHDEAVETKYASIASRSMRYNWALETSAWCGTAIGFTKTGILDDEAVKKCACFHWVMIHQ
jgi:hypothetical protein